MIPPYILLVYYKSVLVPYFFVFGPPRICAMLFKI
jgi:hypothetical protein